MYHMVIVDDEPKICEGLVYLYPWEQSGFRVDAFFTDGETALGYISSHPEISLVMTDIEMPGMNGVELAGRLADRDIVVVFFSAYQDFNYALGAILNHVFDYLLKPVSFDSITSCLERVKKLLDSKTAPEPAGDMDIAGFVEDYIRKNYRTATLEGAAQAAHYSPAYLSGAFKSASGKTFSEYLTGIRMRKALELLNAQKKICDISEMVGYKNPKNLSRNFHLYFGITPQEYRAGRKPVMHAEDDDI